MKNSLKKNKFNKKTAICILSAFLALVVFVVASLFVLDSTGPANPKKYHKFLWSAFNGSYVEEGSPQDYYQVNIQKELETGEVLYSCVNLKISATNSKNISEIWINISDLYESELDIFLSKGTDSTTTFLKDYKITKSSMKKNEDGWFKIYNNKSGGLVQKDFYGELKIGFSANIKFREMVIIDVDGNFGSINVVSCSNGKKPTPEKRETHVKIDKGDAENIVGESGTFPYLNK